MISSSVLLLLSSVEEEDEDDVFGDSTKSKRKGETFLSLSLSLVSVILPFNQAMTSEGGPTQREKLSFESVFTPLLITPSLQTRHP
jgi:hypothetical protein